MTDLSYVNCQITVHDETKLTFRSPYAEDLSHVSLGGDGLTLQTIECLAAWVEAEILRRQQLELLGKHLYRCLFGDAESRVHQRFQLLIDDFAADTAGAKDQRLRLTLAFEKDAVRLASFPWEFLYIDRPDGGYFVAAPSTASQLILTRFVPPPPQVVNSLEPTDKPLRILVVVSSPTAPSLATVRSETLLEELKKLSSEQVDVQVLHNPRLREINDKLDPKDGEPWWPHIFHFVGHGDVHGETPVVAIRMSQEDENLQFANTGMRIPDAQWMPTTGLQELFPAQHEPKLVFLHACRGAKAQSYRAFASGAENFVKSGVPAAIAMQYDIRHEEADFFAQRFYQALRSGAPVDDAVTEARVQLAKRTAPHSWNERGFGTPLLFLQSQKAVILRPLPAAAAGRPPEDTIESFGCPYGMDPDVRCKRLIRPGTEQCPKCLGELYWCVNGHPCMSDDRRCERCGVELAASPPHAPPKIPREESGFD